MLKNKYLLVILLSAAVISVNPRINGWNDASRMALTQSLVESHTFQIDNSTFVNTGDKVRVQGHFYSDKPPVPALLAAVIYWPLYYLGLELDYGWNPAYYLIVLLSVKLMWLLSVLAFRQVLRFTPASEEQHVKLTLIFAFASLMFSWSATFNNHSLAASSLMIALMFYLTAKHDSSRHTLLWSGLFFGLAAVSDVPTGVFLLGFGVLVLLQYRLRCQTLWFLLAALLPVSIHFIVNYQIGKTLLPLQIVPEFLDYPSSAWAHSSAVTGVRINAPLFSLKYALLSLLGPRGFLWYNPLLWLLLPILWHHIHRGQRFQRESVVILIGTLVLGLYYTLFSSNYSGWSYSLRWLVPLLPLIYFYLFDIYNTYTRPWQSRWLQVFTVAAVIIALVGLVNPWSNLDLSPIPFMANIKQLLGFLF